ncbi:hypothetical protein SAMN05428981_101190 [Bacillus sp. OV194]|nr:hypothetical protein SAMN05428981_101190 [Bacillus sp. OV194]
MLADIHNKLSTTGSNLSDRLEDLLTGNFFGTIRYLPFEAALGHILKKAIFEQDDEHVQWSNFIEKERGFDAVFEFWPKHHEGEIDLRLQLGGTFAGIEVKYLSGLSSEDDGDAVDLQIDYKESRNQLARYARMLAEISKGKTAYLIFLAPFVTMKSVQEAIRSRSIIEPGVHLGFLSWEDVLETLNELPFGDLDLGRKQIVQDLQELLRKKRFERFTGFSQRLLAQEVSDEHYQFSPESLNNTVSWSWNTQTIKEEEHYVFNA